MTSSAAAPRSEADMGAASLSRISFIADVTDDTHRGEGLSAAIPKGLLVLIDGNSVAQEGLGIGAVALKRGGMTYFPSICLTHTGEGMVVKRFPRWSALVFESPRFPLGPLMPLYGLATATYMALPLLQDRLLGLRSRFFSLLDVGPVFREVGEMAEANMVYRLRGSTVEVECTVTSSDGPVPAVYVMNELGADRFDASWSGSEAGAPPSGWCELPLRAPPALLDRRDGMAFSIDRIEPFEGSKARLFWGRERGADLCWAGFELELTNDLGLRTVGVRYVIGLTEVGR